MKKNRPTMVSAAVDKTTGKVYRGESSHIANNINELLEPYTHMKSCKLC